MTHFVLLCPAANGHLNPMTSLGFELRQRGHRVTLVGILDAQAAAIAAGLDFCPIGEAAFPLGAMSGSFKRLGELSGTAALKHTIDLFTQATLTYLKEAPAVLRQLGAEVLLIDQTCFGGNTIADQLELPFVSVCCALMLNRDRLAPPLNTVWPYSPSRWAQLRNWSGYQLLDQIGRGLRRMLDAERHRLHLPPVVRINDNYSRLAQVSQQPSAFEFPRADLPDTFHFTGPWANPSSRTKAEFPFEGLTNQPLIYASLGTIQNRLFKTFEAIAQACQGLDAQLVIALGGGSDPQTLPPLPGSPLVVGYAPQLELLQRASLTITHAGLNTTLESLSNGVPMVAIPITNDQPGVAARIAWTGTGGVVPLRQATAANLRRAVTTVLGEDAYRARAQAMQRTIQTGGGVQQAADVVEQVARTGRPVVANAVPGN